MSQARDGHGEHGADLEHDDDRHDDGGEGGGADHAHHGSGDHGSHGADGDHGGHGDHGDHSPEAFRKKFWLSLLLTIPVLAYSHHVQQWLGFRPPQVPGEHLIPFVLGTVIFVYGGTVFLRGGLGEISRRRPGMMTLISIAIVVAFSYSVAVTFGLPGDALYWELATLVTIMLLGHWLEMRAVQGAEGALDEIARLLPDTAQLIEEEDVREVAVGELSPGDVVLIRPGARVPADGVVVSGQSHLDESLLTGESVPVSKSGGDEVIAGAVNAEGSLRVRVSGTGENTALAGIMRLVAEAQASKSKSERLADRAAFLLTVVALSAAAVTAIAWTSIGADTPFTLERVVTVLVAACPHALGLAIPLVVSLSTSIAARNGLLIKDRLAMEDARLLDAVVFDKTGTLTTGRHEVVDVLTYGDGSEGEVLRLAASAEADSEHPVARAVGDAARDRDLQIPAAEDFEALAGRGVRAMVEDAPVYVGGPNLMEELEIVVPDEGWRAGVHVVRDGLLLGSIVTADGIRQESREAVQMLRDRGIEVIMLTGDSAGVAETVAEDLGLDRYFAEVLPGDKAHYVEELRSEGLRVAMVGDGVNDAPALAAADVGVAIGAGTDVALETADIILVRDDPRDVVRMIDLSRATYRKMVENLVWASGYNVVVIPLAAGVLAARGFILPMAVGALIMSASTIVVALNAQLLRRFRAAEA